MAIGAFATWNQTEPTHYVAVVSLALAAGTVGFGPRGTAIRLWMASALAAAAVAVGFATASYPVDRQIAVWALSGLGLVVLAQVWRRRPAEHLAVIGHIVATVALILYPGGTPGAIVVAGWSAGWIVAAVGDATRGASVTALMGRAIRRAGGESADRGVAASRWAVPLLMAASVTPAVLTVAAEWDEFAANRSWTEITLAAIALGHAVAARLARHLKPLARVLAIAAAINSVIGLAVAAPETWPMIFAATALIAVAAVLTGDLRAPGFVWLAWITTVLLALLIGDAVGLRFDRLYMVSLGWVGVLLLGGLLLDDLPSGRRAPGQGLRVQWLKYPVLIGAAVIPLSLGPISQAGVKVFGWSALAAAAGYFVIAYLLRMGSVTIPAYGLAALAAGALSPWSLLDEPLRLVVVAAPMVLLSWLLGMPHRHGPEPDAWVRWDLPPLAVAHVVAGFALAFSLGNDTLAPTGLAFGGLSIVIGLWKRHRAWIDAGNVLVIGAGADGGTGWLSLAFAVTAVRGAVGAALSTGVTRLSNHGIGIASATASWIALGFWQDWSETEIVTYTALAFAGLALLVSGTGRLKVVRTGTVRTWGTLATVGVAVAGLATINPGGDPYIDGPWLAIGLAVLAVAYELSADSAGPDMRLASPIPAGLAWIALGFGLDWTRTEVVTIRALAFAGLALVVAALGRFRLLRATSVRVWGTLATVGVAVAGLAAINPGGDPYIDGPWLAIGFALLAVAYELAANSAGPDMRLASPIPAGLAWIALGFGVGWKQAGVRHCHCARVRGAGAGSRAVGTAPEDVGHDRRALGQPRCGRRSAGDPALDRPAGRALVESEHSGRAGFSSRGVRTRSPPRRPQPEIPHHRHRRSGLARPGQLDGMG